MNVFLANAYPQMPRSYIPLVRDLAARDRYKVHTLVEQAEEADLILYVDARSDFNDYYLGALRRHELVRRYPERCMMYNEIFNGWPALPGLFVSPQVRRYDPHRQRPCGYIVGVLNPYCEGCGEHEAMEPTLLYSFAGRPVCPMRQSMMAIDHPRGLIEDTTGYNYFRGALDSRLMDKQREYADMIRRTKYVLCPRGIATSSYRLYEAMAAGRAPVIISDAWVAPRGPDWSSFAVFIPEKDVDAIPERLESIEDEATDRGRQARKAYEEWFGSDVRFHWMVEWCGEILSSRRVPERIMRRVPNQQVIGHRLRQARHTTKRRIKAAIRA